MPDNTNAEQAWVTFNVVNSDTTTRSQVGSYDTTNQGSHRDAVCRLSKAFPRFNMDVKGYTNSFLLDAFYPPSAPCTKLFLCVNVDFYLLYIL